MLEGIGGAYAGYDGTHFDGLFRLVVRFGG